MKENRLLKNWKKTITFSRWSRKKNSAFLSMGRSIKIGVLSLAYFLNHVFSAHSQTDTIQIEEVNVSAYRTAMTLSIAPRSISVLYADEIGEAPVISLNDALKSVLNVDARERGVYGIQSDVNIRGGSFEQNVILVNGMRMNDPQTGHFQMNLPFDLIDLQRVEVLKGSSSSLYGNNAYGGAINFITGLSNQNALKVSLLAGENALFGANVSANLSTHKFKNYISFSHKQSEGYIYNTDFRIYNFFYNTKLLTKTGQFEFQAGYLNKAFGANSFYTPRFLDQYEENKTLLSNIKFTGKGKIKVSPSLYWRRNYDKFELFRFEPAPWYQGHNYHRTDVYGGDFNVIAETVKTKLAFGMDLNLEKIISNRLGELLSDSLRIYKTDSLYYNRGNSRQNLSNFFEAQFHFDRLLVSAHLMLNWNSMFEWNLYPGIDFSYHITKNTRLMASINWSGRIPSFTELYYNDAGNIGNSELNTEKGLTYELGSSYVNSGLNIQSAVFYRQGHDIIDWVKTSADANIRWQAQNITEINTFGYEFSAKWTPENTQENGIKVKMLALNYTYLDMSKNSKEYYSKYVLDYLRHNIGFSYAQQILNPLLASVQFNLQFRNGNYLPYNHETNTFEPALPFQPLYMLDLKIQYTIKSIEIFLQGKNLLDQEQQSIENVQLPGRWISGGVNLLVRLKSKRE